MQYRYDALVFIGRFQPFHKGHKAVVDRALTLAKNVIILIGSANTPSTFRNPFTFKERASMIVSAYSPEVTPRLHMYPIEDVPYNDTQWVKQVYETINHAVLTATNDNRNFWASGWNDIHVGLIGCKKDETSYYLDMFPRLRSENVPAVDPEEMLSSTDIRKVFFGQASADQIDRSTVPLPTLRFLHAFSKTERFKTLVEEYRWHEKYRENVKQFPRIEHTVDSVVIQSGYILLVTRKDTPGKGMLAMPGGFLNPKERLLDGAIRELREETKLKVPEPVLRGSLVTSATYDDPNRSERGRLITNAYLFRLNPSFDLPKVKGSDDAAKAEWVALSDLNPLDFFEDHYYIIQDLIRKGGV